MDTVYSSVAWSSPIAPMSTAKYSTTSAGILELAPCPTSSKTEKAKVVVTGNWIFSSLYTRRRFKRIAALTLSSKWRDLIKPVSVIMVRGSKLTKSPTSMPRARVSFSLVTFSSRRTSILSWVRSTVPASL